MGLGALQPGHLIVVLVIVLLVFGPGKLPELGKAMGDGLRELKKATSNEDHTATVTPATTTTLVTSPLPPAPIVTPVTSSSRMCPSCRGSVPVTDKFCGNCGATVEQVSRSA